jgi:3',5'-cyclic-AMP phosphodiesterase
MKNDLNKFLWYTDTHFNRIAPWNLLKLFNNIKNQKPKGIFLTGDISNGLSTAFILKIMAKFLRCPIYFVMGNHDYSFSSFQKTNLKIRNLCKNYQNLVWMTEAEPIALNNDVALIGAEGWYDASAGNTKYLKFTPDWMMIKELRSLSTMEERVKMFQLLANKSSEQIAAKLKTALTQGYKTIYILTHVPGWKQATKNYGTIFENFWLPYNTNLRLGDTIEKIMKNHPDRHVICLAGHTHDPKIVRISFNIECHVGYPYDIKHCGQSIFI